MLDIETLGLPFGWQRGLGDWAGVQATIACSLPVQVIQEAGSTQWQAELSVGHPFQFGFPDFPDRSGRPTPQARIWISPQQRRFDPNSNFPKVQWHPRVLWVGIGCDRGTPAQTIAKAIQTTFRAFHLAEGAIAGVATIDRKAAEAGLLEFCGDRALPLKFFSAEQLGKVAVPTPSDTVAAATSTPSVAEAAALLVSGGELRVAKRIFRPDDRAKAVTIAIAQSVQEYGISDR